MYFLPLNSYMFWIEQFIEGLIQDLTVGYLQLHPEHTVYHCVFCGIPHHVNVSTIKL